MTFLSPSRLLMFGGVIVLVVMYAVAQTRRQTYAVKFTNIDLLDRVAPRRRRWRRHLLAAIFLLAIATLVVGFAQPAFPQQVPRERATIMLALDTSLSMTSTDVSPTRFDAAKSAATSFVDMVPSKVNIGLVSFDSSARVMVAPTTDRAALKAGIERLQLQWWTAIGDAIITSLDAIGNLPGDGQPPAPARIVVMSDGATNKGTPDDQAVQKALKAGVPVTTIAFGTDAGTYTSPDNPQTQLPAPVDRAALQRVADDTHGTFYNAYTAEELTGVYRDIGSAIGYTTENADAAALFIGAALIGLVATATLSLAWNQRLP